MPNFAKSLDERLLDAAENGDPHLCRDLLGGGANIEAVNSVGGNSLHWASSNGHTPVCLTLLEHGANAHVTDHDGWNALHYAASNGHTAICLLLLEHGCDPLIKNNKYRAAMDMAAENSHEDCAGAMRAWLVARAARVVLKELASKRKLKAARSSKKASS